MKRLLFLIHDLGPGGAEKVLINLVNNMNHQKYDITVMALFGGGVNEQFLSPNIHYKSIFKHVFRGNSKLMKLLSPEQLHKLFIKGKYDVEIAYLEGPAARIISGCPNKDTKLVSWIHIQQKSPKKTAASFRSVGEATECYNKFNRIICVSKEVLETFKKQLVINVPVEVLYNTNESDKIIELSEEKVDVFGGDFDDTKIVCVGKLLKSKGFDRVLRVLNKLRQEGYKVSVYILGIGPEKTTLQTYAQDNNMIDCVHLLGYQTNPYKYVAKSDLFVCASFAEGFSTATTEALILGVPVCTVDVSGMKEMLGESNEYGFVVENTEEALYSGLKLLLNNPQLLQHYKEAANIRGKDFNTKNTVLSVERMIDSL